MEELIEWIKSNFVICQIVDNFITIDEFGKFIFIEPKEGKIINPDYSINLSDEEDDILDADKDIKYIVFKWGNRFYYCSTDNKKKNEYNEEVIKPEFNDFRNLGKFSSEFDDLTFSNLAIHTGYELLSGSGEAKDYVKKAKFFNQQSIAICEKNTLAGTLAFQDACKKYGIKSIMGGTVSVAYNYDKEKEHQDLYDIKLYVKNSKGWQNLLRISKQINVDFDSFIPLNNLKEHSEGLICVLGFDSYFYNNIENKKRAVKDLSFFKKTFKDLFIQIDLTEFNDDSLDLERLNKVKFYFNNYSKLINPVYIEDVFYADKVDFEIKSTLGKVDRKASPSSENQHLKSIDEIIENHYDLFSDDKNINLFFKSIQNTKRISKVCNFIIDTGHHKLPKFEVENPVELYYELIEEGFKKKVKRKFKGEKKKIKEYRKRINEENDVIVNAGFVDYFLILWDVVRWARENNILVGPGRGSAGGSLVAYMLGIIEIDPIEYDLLFERFLNKTRVSGERAKAADALPDIDIDFEGSRRQDVKRYIEQKYGIHHVCSIGTYTRLKTKSAMKDFSRVKGLDFKKVNFATKEIPDAIDFDWSDLFTNSMNKKLLKDFVQENVDICELMKTSLGQPRSASIHPSAVIIVPKEDKDGNPMEIYDWMPIKKIDGQIVSEWEGKYIDEAGFLKEDILGIAQLDKFAYMVRLIEENHKETLDLNTIETDDKRVYKYFSNGWNEDVFQFGTAGLKNYSAKVKPEGIEDLISMNALFRPGPMDSKAHEDFVNFKRGKKKAIIDLGMEEVVKNTQGLYIYQEQVMQAMVVGGLSLSEADEVRTAMKKFDKVKLSSYKERWVIKYVEVLKNNGLKKNAEKYAEKVWDKLNAFSSYGFNRSHAAAYSLMGYWSQWLKVNYPLEFWTASLNFADEKEEIPKRISEIKRIKGGIKVSGADINQSDIKFTSDPKQNKIYWSLTKIKFVGDKAVEAILEERKNGNFYSIEEFLKRVNKSKVNKRVMACLIQAGAFDEIGSEEIPFNKRSQPRNRLILMKKYFESRGEEIPEDIMDDKNKTKNWFWLKRQKELTGHGDINYKLLVRKKWKSTKLIDKMYMDGDIFNEKVLSSNGEKKAVVAGTILELKRRMSKNGEYAVVTIESNNSLVLVHLWNDTWVKRSIQSKLLELTENKKMMSLSGMMKFDSWKGKNVLFVNEDTKIIELI